MSEKLTLNHHPSLTFIYLASIFLERFVYFGVRSVIILYLISETVSMNNVQAYTIYGYLLGGYALSKLLGGLLGDLLIGNKWAWISGGILQGLGCFVLILPNVSSIYVGLALFILGGGFIYPNYLAHFGKPYLNKKTLSGSAYTAFYVISTVGSFLGVFVIGLIFTEVNSTSAFALSGVLAIGAIVIPMLFNPQNVKPSEFSKQLSTRTLYLIAIPIILGLFWLGYEFTYSKVYELQYTLTDADPQNALNQVMIYLPGIAIMILGIILFFALSFKQVPSLIKLIAGFFIGLLSITCFIFVPEDTSNISAFTILSVGIMLMAVAEVLVIPSIYAAVIKYTNPKYLAILFSILGVPFSIVVAAQRLFSESFYNSPKLLSFTIALVVFGILFISLGIGYFIRLSLKKDNGTSTPATSE